jgi:hydroxymethylpyrimidine/phosphomethylpyrimidine kinase
MKTIGDKLEAFSVPRHSSHDAQRAPALLARALTIGGSDSGGGTRIQADLKTFSAFRVYGMSVLTTMMAQNTIGVQGVETLSLAFITAQFESVVSDIGVEALKTGMLGTAAVVVVVAAMIAKAGLPNLVVDPVMVAKSGDHLLAENAVHALRTRRLPLAFVKGGHGGGDTVTDLLYDGQTFDRLDGARIDTPHTHGTGCTFSAAMTACLARGKTVPEAFAAAKQYTHAAIVAAPGLGHGHGPLNHLVSPWDEPN